VLKPNEIGVQIGLLNKEKRELTEELGQLQSSKAGARLAQTGYKIFHTGSLINILYESVEHTNMGLEEITHISVANGDKEQELDPVKDLGKILQSGSHINYWSPFPSKRQFDWSHNHWTLNDKLPDSLRSQVSSGLEIFVEKETSHREEDARKKGRVVVYITLPKLADEKTIVKVEGQQYLSLHPVYVAIALENALIKGLTSLDPAEVTKVAQKGLDDFGRSGARLAIITELTERQTKSRHLFRNNGGDTTLGEILDALSLAHPDWIVNAIQRESHVGSGKFIKIDLKDSDQEIGAGVDFKVFLPIQRLKRLGPAKQKEWDLILRAIVTKLDPSAFTIAEIHDLDISGGAFSDLLTRETSKDNAYLKRTGERKIVPGHGRRKYTVYSLSRVGLSRAQALTAGSRLAELKKARREGGGVKGNYLLTLASRVARRFSWPGIATRTASSTASSLVSTDARRSLTSSMLSPSAVWPSATTRNLDSSRSTSAATSFGVKPLVGSGISNSSITERPSLSGNITSVNSTGARLAKKKTADSQKQTKAKVVKSKPAAVKRQTLSEGLSRIVPDTEPLKYMTSDELDKLQKYLEDIEDRFFSGSRLAEVEKLIKELKDNDPRVSGNARFVLGLIGPAAKAAVPALIDALKDKDSDVRYFAAQALGLIGPKAYKAVPTLTTISQEDSSEFIRKSAGEAIRQIQSGARLADDKKTQEPEEAIDIPVGHGMSLRPAVWKLQEILREDKYGLDKTARRGSRGLEHNTLSVKTFSIIFDTHYEEQRSNDVRYIPPIKKSWTTKILEGAGIIGVETVYDSYESQEGPVKHEIVFGPSWVDVDGRRVINHLRTPPLQALRVIPGKILLVLSPEAFEKYPVNFHVVRGAESAGSRLATIDRIRQIQERLVEIKTKLSGLSKQEKYLEKQPVLKPNEIGVQIGLLNKEKRELTEELGQLQSSKAGARLAFDEELSASDRQQLLNGLDSILLEHRRKNDLDAQERARLLELKSKLQQKLEETEDIKEARLALVRYTIFGARLSASSATNRDGLRRTGVGQEPTFASSFPTREVNEGIATRTASSTDVRRSSTPDNRSSTPDNRPSTFSKRSSSPVTPSATTRNSDFNPSTSVATSLGVNDLGSLGMPANISKNPGLVKRYAQGQNDITGARLTRSVASNVSLAQIGREINTLGAAVSLIVYDSKEIPIIKSNKSSGEQVVEYLKQVPGLPNSWNLFVSEDGATAYIIQPKFPSSPAEAIADGSRLASGDSIAQQIKDDFVPGVNEYLTGVKEVEEVQVISKPHKTEGFYGIKTVFIHAHNFAAHQVRAWMHDLGSKNKFAKDKGDEISTYWLRRYYNEVISWLKGEVVIGEGERDKAPMLYIGEKVGGGYKDLSEKPQTAIAVDTLELTNGIIKKKILGSVSIAAYAPYGGIKRAPDIYISKWLWGPKANEAGISVNKTTKENIHLLSTALKKDVSDLKGALLLRPSHVKTIVELIESGIDVNQDELLFNLRNKFLRYDRLRENKEAGEAVDDLEFQEAWRELDAAYRTLDKKVKDEGVYQIQNLYLLADGDLMPAFALATGELDFITGRGGAPEGEITAAIVKSFGGGMSATYVSADALSEASLHADLKRDGKKWSEKELERLDKQFGISGEALNEEYNADDLVSADDFVVVASAVKASPWIKMAEPGFNFETGEFTSFVVRATGAGDVRVFKVVYETLAHDLRPKIENLQAQLAPSNIANKKPVREELAQHYFDLGLTYLKYQHFTEAIEAFTRAQEFDRTDERFEAAREQTLAMQALILGLDEDGQPTDKIFETAIKHFEKAVAHRQIRDSRLHSRDTLLDLYKFLGDEALSQAKSYFESQKYSEAKENYLRAQYYYNSVLAREPGSPVRDIAVEIASALSYLDQTGPVGARLAITHKVLRSRLNKIAKQMVPPTGGILAADESVGSAKKRLDLVGLENTPENRQKMRVMMLTVHGQKDAGISAVILDKDTLTNVDSTGRNLVKGLVDNVIVPGLKTDAGVGPDKESPHPAPEGKLDQGETVPNPAGLENLPGLLEKAKAQGIQFTKWRVTVYIDPSRNLPTDDNIRRNMAVLAKSAKMTQLAGLVPILEPEVLYEGTPANHTIEQSYEATTRTLDILFEELNKAGVWLDGIVLKTSMILPGKNSPQQVDSQTIGGFTFRGLVRSVHPEVPAVVFLSGGQKDDQANENLNSTSLERLNEFEAIREAAAVELEAKGKPEAAQKVRALTPEQLWQLSFSFGRGLQMKALLAWAGKDENFDKGQAAALESAKNSQKARQGLLHGARLATPFGRKTEFTDTPLKQLVRELLNRPEDLELQEMLNSDTSPKYGGHDHLWASFYNGKGKEFTETELRKEYNALLDIALRYAKEDPKLFVDTRAENIANLTRGDLRRVLQLFISSLAQLKQERDAALINAPDLYKKGATGAYSLAQTFNTEYFRLLHVRRILDRLIVLGPTTLAGSRLANAFNAPAVGLNELFRQANNKSISESVIQARPNMVRLTRWTRLDQEITVLHDSYGSSDSLSALSQYFSTRNERVINPDEWAFFIEAAESRRQRESMKKDAGQIAVKVADKLGIPVIDPVRRISQWEVADAVIKKAKELDGTITAEDVLGYFTALHAIRSNPSKTQITDYEPSIQKVLLMGWSGHTTAKFLRKAIDNVLTQQVSHLFEKKHDLIVRAQKEIEQLMTLDSVKAIPQDSRNKKKILLIVRDDLASKILFKGFTPTGARLALKDSPKYKQVMADLFILSKKVTEIYSDEEKINAEARLKQVGLGYLNQVLGHVALNTNVLPEGIFMTQADIADIIRALQASGITYERKRKSSGSRLASQTPEDEAGKPQASSEKMDISQLISNIQASIEGSRKDAGPLSGSTMLFREGSSRNTNAPDAIVSNTIVFGIFQDMMTVAAGYHKRNILEISKDDFTKDCSTQIRLPKGDLGSFAYWFVDQVWRERAQSQGARLASRIKNFDEIRLKVNAAGHVELGFDPQGFSWGELPLDLNDPTTVQEFSRMLELMGLANIKKVFRTDETPRVIIVTSDGQSFLFPGIMFYHFPTQRNIVIQFDSSLRNHLSDYLTLIIMNRGHAVSFEADKDLLEFSGASVEFDPTTLTFSINPSSGARLAVAEKARQQGFTVEETSDAVIATKPANETNFQTIANEARSLETDDLRNVSIEYTKPGSDKITQVRATFKGSASAIKKADSSRPADAGARLASLEENFGVVLKDAASLPPFIGQSVGAAKALAAEGQYQGALDRVAYVLSLKTRGVAIPDSDLTALESIGQELIRLISASATKPSTGARLAANKITQNIKTGNGTEFGLEVQVSALEGVHTAIVRLTEPVRKDSEARAARVTVSSRNAVNKDATTESVFQAIQLRLGSYKGAVDVNNLEHQIGIVLTGLTAPDQGARLSATAIEPELLASVEGPLVFRGNNPIKALLNRERSVTTSEESTQVSKVKDLLRNNPEIKQAVQDFFVGLEIFPNQQGENRPLALQTDQVTASPYTRVVHGDALSIQLYGEEIIPAFDLNQAKEELKKRLSEEQRATKNNRTIEYQITKQVLAFAEVNDRGVYQGYVEVPVNAISDQLSDDREFAEVIGFLQAYARARKGFNIFFSGINEKILGKARFAVVDSALGVLVDEWNSDKRTGHISLNKPENAVIAKINFVDPSRPSVPALDPKQEVAVPTAGFNGGNVSNLIGAVELGQRLATVYTDIRKTHHNEIPSVADEDVVQTIQKSSIPRLVRELTGIKSGTLTAAELHDAFTARNLASYLKFVIEPLLRYLDDRLRAIQIMQKVAIFA